MQEDIEENRNQKQHLEAELTEVNQRIVVKDSSILRLEDEVKQAKSELQSTLAQLEEREEARSSKAERTIYEHLETISYLENQRLELDEVFAEQQSELDR